MPFTHLNPEQIETLSGVLNEHCREKGFPVDGEECNEAGRLLMSLYEMGWREPDELKAMLAVEPGEAIRILSKRPPYHG